MPYLLTEASAAQCSHAGSAKPLVGNLRVKAAGSPVLTVASQFTVSGCPNMAGTSPFPCAVGSFPGGATRIKVTSTPALLDISKAAVVPTGASLTITSTQQRVKGQ